MIYFEIFIDSRSIFYFWQICLNAPETLLDIIASDYKFEREYINEFSA